MLNTLIKANDSYYYPQAKAKIAFTGGLYSNASRSSEAQTKILAALNEYFVDIEPKVFRELFDANTLGHTDFWNNLKRYLHENPPTFNKLRENAQKIAANRIEFLNGMFQSAKHQCGVSGKSLIDIGSGDGKVTQELVNLFGINNDKVLGVEINALPEHNALGFRTMLYNGENLSRHVNDKYDIAALVSTLHHSKNPEGLLEQAYKTLNNDGYLIVVEHQPNSEADRLFHNFMDKFEHAIVGENGDFPITNNFRSAEQWRRIMERCGFKIVQIIEPSEGVNNPFRRVCFVAQKIPAQKINEAYQVAARTYLREIS